MPALPSRSEIGHGRRRVQCNAVFVAALWAVAYGLLVLPQQPLLARVVGAALMVVATVAAATSVMHDANHGAFASRRRVNLVVGCTLDALGGSSLLWRRSHNVVHHRSPNVVGVDADIDQMPFARLAPAQPWRPWHRFQHVYMWPLYGFVALKWFLHSDFAALASGGIGPLRFARARRSKVLTRVMLGKVLHVSWAIVIPLWLHPWWGVLACYLACSWVAGLLLATMFQIAHCVEEVDFTEADVSRRGAHWAEHQLRTTCNVGTRLPVFGGLARWLMGGLDQQVEHHLAPGLPHGAYPVFSPQVRSFCAASGLRYREHATVVAAVRSHTRWLRTMGRPPLQLR